MNGHILANNVVITDMEFGRFISIFEIRRGFTYGRELVDMIASTDPCRALDNDMGLNYGALAYFDIRPNQRPGTDPH